MHPILFEVFESLSRQGPGDHATTARALELCPSLPDAPRTLDLGCGAGAQTLDLLSLTGGTVTAVDAHAPFIERLRRRATERGVAERVDARVADMTRLDPQPHDLVWSEGALYNLGLSRALDLCATQLVPGGTLAFTAALDALGEEPRMRRRHAAHYGYAFFVATRP